MSKATFVYAREWPANRAFVVKGPSVTEMAFWFLDALVESSCALCALGSAEIGLLLNRRPHGLSHEALVRTLLGLHARGWVFFSREHPLELAPTPAMLRAEVDAATGHASCVCAYLTPAGGAAWEAAAHPDWTRFIDGPWFRPDDQTIEVHGMDQARLERELRPSFNLFHTEETRVREVHWDLVRPWQATYWKVLPFAHRVRGRYDTIPHPKPSGAQLARLRQEAVQRTTFLAWYRAPFGI